MAENGTGQTVSVEQLLQIIGTQTVELQIVKAQLQTTIKQLADVTNKVAGSS